MVHGASGFCQPRSHSSSQWHDGKLKPFTAVFLSLLPTDLNTCSQSANEILFKFMKLNIFRTYLTLLCMPGKFPMTPLESPLFFLFPYTLLLGRKTIWLKANDKYLVACPTKLLFYQEELKAYFRNWSFLGMTKWFGRHALKSIRKLRALFC